MRIVKVKSDDKGLYVRDNGYIFRPGVVSGTPETLDMSDGDLREGDVVYAKHIPCSEKCRVILMTRHELVWHMEYRHEQEKHYNKIAAFYDCENAARVALCPVVHCHHVGTCTLPERSPRNQCVSKLQIKRDKND